MKDKTIRKLVHDWLVSEDQEKASNPAAHENYRNLAESCYYSIIESFTPDCPGWTGSILTVVFGYDACLYTFRIKDNKLERLISEV